MLDQETLTVCISSCPQKATSEGLTTQHQAVSSKSYRGSVPIGLRVGLRDKGRAALLVVSLMSIIPMDAMMENCNENCSWATFLEWILMVLRSILGD
jgi:hypothetical protein